MASVMTSGLRRGFVAVLALALILSGLGRSMASPSLMGDLRRAIAGVPVPICHAGGVPIDPSLPSSHDCCDACALSATAVLPAPLGLRGPAPPRRFARGAPVLGRVPAMARARDPRLSRGPPSA